MNLPKPLAVLFRSSSIAQSTAINDGDHEDGREGDDMETMDVDGESQGNSAVKTVEWDVVAVVKRKIVFSKRPMPIVNLDSQKKS